MKKTFLFLITLLAVLFIALGTAALADTLTLPADLTAVDDQAFYGDQSLGTVVLPEHLETIGSKAFAGSGVKTVNLPDSLTFIADDAFDDTAVTALTVNEGTYAYTWAVNHGYFGWEYDELLDGTVEITGYTEGLRTVTIPRQIAGKQVSGIADMAFAGSAVFVNVTIPGTISRIGEAAFAGIRALETVTVCQGVKNIGSEAFTDCPNLISVTLPDSGVNLGGKLFRYCQLLETVNLPNGIAEVPFQCFWDCQSLQRIVIPDGATAISDGAFYNCFSLASVTVPDSLVSIGRNAFHACMILEEITLSEHTTDIHETAFSDCAFLVMHAPEGSVAAQYAIDHELVPENVEMESPHPYQESGIWEYTHYEDAAALLVTFSSKTDVTGYYDMDSLYVTDAYGRKMQYKGTKLAGETLMLAGNTFTVYLKEVWSTGSEFGFRITSVIGLSQEEYEARLAEIEQNPCGPRHTGNHRV